MPNTQNDFPDSELCTNIVLVTPNQVAAWQNAAAQQPGSDIYVETLETDQDVTRVAGQLKDTLDFVDQQAPPLGRRAPRELAEVRQEVMSCRAIGAVAMRITTPTFGDYVVLVGRTSAQIEAQRLAAGVPLPNREPGHPSGFLAQLKGRLRRSTR